MSISKLFKKIMAFAGLFGLGVGEEGGGGEPLDAFSAASAFSDLLGGDAEPDQQDDESPEAAAERLAKQELSGEVEGQPDTGEGEPAPAADDITVEIDGKAVRLTKEQIAESYKNGLRQKDYTQKTMAAAETVKAAEAEKAAARTERDSYAQKLNNFAIATQSALQEQAAVLTQELAQNDPQEYLIQKHIFDQRQAQLGQAQQELHQISQQQQQERADWQRAHLETQRAQLLAKLPEWSDPKKAATEQGAIKEYLTGQGFEAGDLASINDHRLVILSRKAMQYDALIERASKAVKKVAALPTRAERAGSAETSKPDGRTAAMQRLGKTGSIDAAAGAFMQFMK
jgi:hypothetical protein